VLQDRRSECGTVDRLLEGVRVGRSGALVVRGEPGVGKSALLEYLTEQASGCRVARAAGVECEMELAFAGLHQLCAPMLDRWERLPGPQRDALGVVFGLTDGDAPDRFVVGLAVLSLLSDVAQERPLVCSIDDAQWLDRESAQALAFVARRLVAESVVMVFAAREPGPELAGVPELVVAGLPGADARALLRTVIRGPLDARVRDRIVAETRGNPLALLELPRGASAAELAGGFGLPDALPLSSRIEESYRRRLEALPAESQRLLLLAAADPIGDPVLVWHAAERLGIRPEAAAPAATAGLLEFRARDVRFRHPLVRSAVYRAAPLEDRQRVHRALAEATDPELDPDHRAWHRAHAAPGPDEEVAAELERSADRARARGGLAAAAAFLESATGLTRQPARRATRALAAAGAKHEAGAFDAALGLLATAEAGPLDEVRGAQAELLRAQIAFDTNPGSGSDAPPLMLKAANRLAALDVTLARETYLAALSAALFAGSLGRGVGVLQVAEAARTAGPPLEPRGAPDLLLDGLALLLTEGRAAGAPTLKRALTAFRRQNISRDEGIRWLWLACHAATDLWDDESWDVLSSRLVQLTRDAGALAVLPIALNTRAGFQLRAGEFAAAASLVEEARAVTEVTGSHLLPYSDLMLAAWQGREAEAAELIDAASADLTHRGQGLERIFNYWAVAVLDNSVGRYEDALAAAEQATEYPEELRFSTWALAELVEAAARSGNAERAADGLRRLSETTRPSGTDWALGIEARSRAMLSQGQVAESLYREAIDRLGRTRIRVDVARAHLVYGEWLRRERRGLDAREQLRTAHEMFTAIGMDAFAERASRELLAAGESARKRTVKTGDQLTAQEAQIARLARDGLSNPEIGARLFLSPRTVEYHLRKIVAKLNIRSRTQLHRVLAADGDGAQRA
jgi:DNA-binding CsgD family transcriptional regulator